MGRFINGVFHEWAISRVGVSFGGGFVNGLFVVGWLSHCSLSSNGISGDGIARDDEFSRDEISIMLGIFTSGVSS